VSLRLKKPDSCIENLAFSTSYETPILAYDLVFAHPSGRPMEAHAINSAPKKLIRENDLPDVVFHSFRHASITYKLKWTGGDIFEMC
jgi:hypothetical protein